MVAAILAVPPLQQPLNIFSRVPVEKSPAALEDRARELLARLGHADPAADAEVGFTYDGDYFRDVQERTTLPPGGTPCGRASLRS